MMNNLLKFRAYASGAISTAAGAATSYVTLACEGAASFFAQVLTVSSLSGCTLVFEGRITPSAPWVVLAAYATNGTAKGTAIAVTPALSTLPTNGWVVACQGCAEVRVRATAISGGSLTLGIKVTDATFA